MTNPFKNVAPNSLTGFARDILPITPSDSADVIEGGALVGIICKGSAGTVSIVTASGNTRDVPIDEGETLPCGVLRVRATGTTATGIWGFIA